MEGADDDCALSNAPHKEPTCWLHSFHALPPRRVAPGGDPLRISIAFDAALPRAPEVAWTADDRAPRSVVRTRAYAGPRPPPGPDPPDWSCGRDGTWLRDFATHGRRGLVVDDLVQLARRPVGPGELRHVVAIDLGPQGVDHGAAARAWGGPRLTPTAATARR